MGVEGEVIIEIIIIVMRDPKWNQSVLIAEEMDINPTTADILLRERRTRILPKLLHTNVWKRSPSQEVRQGKVSFLHPLHDNEVDRNSEKNVDKVQLVLAYHELCIDDMIDVYSDSHSDVEYSNIDSLVEKIVLHSDIFADSYSYEEMSVCLDSCAGESIFRTKKLSRNFRQSDSPVIVRGVNSDSSPMIVIEEGETEFGTVY